MSNKMAIFFAESLAKMTETSSAITITINTKTSLTSTDRAIALTTASTATTATATTLTPIQQTNPIFKFCSGQECIVFGGGSLGVFVVAFLIFSLFIFYKRKRGEF